MAFDHWKQLGSDPLEEGSKANVLVKSIRKRKGLKIANIPSLDYFMDKL